MNKEGLDDKIKLISYLLIILFAMFSGFSNAPGYHHHAITIPIALSFIILIVSVLQIKFSTTDKILISLVFACVIMLVVSVFLVGINTKTFNYSLAHIWLISFILSLYLLINNNNIHLTYARNYLFAGLIISLVWILFEAFVPYFGVDIGSYLPRISRHTYEIYSGFGFYRVRGFNYESAYLAMYVNVAFSIIIGLSKRYRPELFLLWMVSLLLTASLAQIALFILINLFIFSYQTLSYLIKNKKSANLIYLLSNLKNNKRSLFWYFGFIFLLLMLVSNLAYWISWFKAFVLWYQHNLTGQTPSSLARLNNLQSAIELIRQGFPWGLGMGVIQDLGYKGLSSFYLALVAQLGILSIPFFLLILYLFLMTIQTGNKWLVAAFIFAFAHLLIIDAFYLPQVFLPILFTFVVLKQQKSENV